MRPELEGCERARKSDCEQLPAHKTLFQAALRCGQPVAWIEETGRRVTSTTERAIARRWSGLTEQRPLSPLQLRDKLPTCPTYE